MCSQARCSRCGKATWRGCGQHIEQALAGVPASQRCRCEPEPHRGLLDRLRGR